MKEVIIYSIWNISAIFFGVVEAWIFAFKNKINKSEFTTHVNKLDEHFIFSIQRSLVMLIIIVLFNNAWDIHTMFKETILIIGMILSFPFFHDGMYYTERNNLESNIYSKRWVDDSITSTAKIEIKYHTRIIMFLVSILIVIVSILV